MRRFFVSVSFAWAHHILDGGLLLNSSSLVMEGKTGANGNRVVSLLFLNN